MTYTASPKSLTLTTIIATAKVVEPYNPHSADIEVELISDKFRIKKAPNDCRKIIWGFFSI